MAAVRCRRPLHPSLYDRLERQTEHLLGQEPQQRRGRASPRGLRASQGLEEGAATLAHPLKSPFFVRCTAKVADEMPEKTGSGFPWKSPTTEFTNPTGCSSKSRTLRMAGVTLRISIASVADPFAIEPHVTIVHPRTSEKRREAWVELAGRAVGGELKVDEVAVTAFDGVRWLSVSTYPLRG
jgi:hypothetical protein